MADGTERTVSTAWSLQSGSRAAGVQLLARGSGRAGTPPTLSGGFGGSDSDVGREADAPAPPGWPSTISRSKRLEPRLSRLGKALPVRLDLRGVGFAVRHDKTVTRRVGFTRRDLPVAQL